MILVTWNIIGFNDPHKVSVVKKLLKSHNVNIIGILETQVKAHKVLGIQRKFGRQGVHMWKRCTLLQTVRPLLWYVEIEVSVVCFGLYSLVLT